MSPHLHRALLVLACSSILLLIGFVQKFSVVEPLAPGAAAPASGLNPEAVSLLNSPIQPIPSSLELDPNKLSLGARLFQDPQLSSNGTISCSSCHDLRAGGDDGRPLSIGVDGRYGTHNAPTVFNSGFNFRQFWDGRAASLEEQVDGPLRHAGEMGMDWDNLLERLRASESYIEEFELAFGRAPDRAAVQEAIAEFERGLITPGSAFDRFLLGDEGAISEAAKAGYELFLDLGCVSCHQGTNIGGNMFQHLGRITDFFEGEGRNTVADQGRFNVTGNERDRYKFKVPTLRNISQTAPYFHDGSVETLSEAVELMARYQLGFDLDAAGVQSIVLFLETLSAELPEGIQAKIK